jgi:hypothetical protein
MPQVGVIHTMVIVPLTQDAREISRQVQRDIREAVQEAREQVREAREARLAQEPAVAGGATSIAGSDVNAAIELLRAEITGVKQEIATLTQQLDGTLSDARESVVTDQIDNASDRLESLQERLDRLISGDQTITVTEAPQSPFPPDFIPPQAVDIATMFFITLAVIAIGIPLARGFSRWAERRGQSSAPDVTPRLDRIEQAIESVAIEVERISEGQRFSNKLMNELRALPAGEGAAGWAAQRQGVPVRNRED